MQLFLYVMPGHVNKENLTLVLYILCCVNMYYKQDILTWASHTVCLLVCPDDVLNI